MFLLPDSVDAPISGVIVTLPSARHMSSATLPLVVTAGLAENSLIAGSVTKKSAVVSARIKAIEKATGATAMLWESASSSRILSTTPSKWL
jgi:hypothetical protein